MDKNTDVRRGVADNRNTPVSLLEKLATDREDWVRWGVAINENTPISLLEKLATDENEGVRRAVKGSLKQKHDGIDTKEAGNRQK